MVGDMIKRVMIVAVVVIAALGMAQSALADAAPPRPAPGDSIQTGYIDTKVQMVSEDVLITVGDDRAYVKANFQLRNQGTAEESFNVRFPIGSSDGYGNPVEVLNFAAYVDGQDSQTSIEYQPMPSCDGCKPLPWATWPVTFPPGQTISIDVIYQLYAKGDYGAFGQYNYILETGAGWYGTIGHGIVAVRLPYEVNELNVRLDKPIDSRPIISPDYSKILGTDVTWEFNNLEPNQRDNVVISVMNPAVWREIVHARKVVKDISSANSHLRLARAYRAAVFDWDPYSYFPCSCHGAYLTIGQASLDEYEKALEAAPNDKTIIVEYAKMLAYMQGPKEKTYATMSRALSLAPNDELLITMSGLLDKWYAHPTSSPEQIFNSFHPTMAPTVAPVSQTLTLKVTSTEVSPDNPVTPSPQVTSDSGALTLAVIVGVVALIGVAAFFAVRWNSRRKSG